MVSGSSVLQYKLMTSVRNRNFTNYVCYAANACFIQVFAVLPRSMPNTHRQHECCIACMEGGLISANWCWFALLAGVPD